MRGKEHLLAIDLSLFDGAAVMGDGGDMGSVTSGGDQTLPPAAGEDTGERERRVPPVAGEETGTGGEGVPASPEDRRKAFLDMVSGDGEYKDLFDEQVQKIINRRFRQTKTLEEQMGRSQPILDMLMKRYGIADGDTDKLRAALEADNTRLLRGRMDQARRQVQGREQVARQMRQWYDEARQVKEAYPDFDLNAEARNTQFLSLLRSGIPVRHAYEVIHMDDIKTSAARQAAREAEKQVVDGIRAKGARPPENGTAAQSAFTVKGDVSKLTRKDREEIARRAARGEKITF